MIGTFCWLAVPLALTLPPSQPPVGTPPPDKVAYDLTGGYRVAHFGRDGRVRALVMIHEDRPPRYQVSVADLATGKALAAPIAHRSLIKDASFSPDGTRVVTACGDGTAAVWDADTGKMLTGPLKHGGAHAEFSPDGARVVAASAGKTACVWDAATGKLVAGPLKTDSECFYAAFSPDGKQVVTQCYGSAALWDAATGAKLGAATVN